MREPTDVLDPAHAPSRVARHPTPTGYVAEYPAAIDHTRTLGLKAAPRVLIAKPCVDLPRTLPVLLDYFDRHAPDALIGQTLAIHFALIPLLYAATGVPFELTVGWIVRQGKPLFQHDEALIRVFLREKRAAWQRLGVPFHLWLTSPALEILDVTFAMNCGWAKSRADCSRLILYRAEHEPLVDPVYHPTIVGPDFFEQTGVVI